MGYSLYVNLEARVTSTELQYHFAHETLDNMPACDSPCVYCTPHSPLVSFAMQLVIHDECLDCNARVTDYLWRPINVQTLKGRSR